MVNEILSFEAVSQIREAMVDGLSDEVLQSILDTIYGKGFFTVIDDEQFKSKVIETEDLGFLKRGLASRNYIV